MDHLAYSDDATNDAGPRTGYVWPAGTQTLPAGDPWSLTPLLGGSTEQNPGFTTPASAYLAQCTYPDDWSSYATPIQGHTHEQALESTRIFSTPTHNFAQSASSFAFSDAALQTGVHTTLYLPSPPPERNPKVQVAPREDEPTSSLTGDHIGNQAPGSENALIERLPGACARCKRLKMKCTFSPQSATCTRCQSGRHECIVEGRKPRTPGQREQLQRQIRSKNDVIAERLREFRWASETATPLSLALGDLSLSSEERVSGREALTWLEKRPRPTHTLERAFALIDTDELEDEALLSDDEDDHDGACASSSSLAYSDRQAAGGVVGFMREWTGKLSPGDGHSPDKGFKCRSYFTPNPCTDLDVRRIVIEREQVPDILLSGLLSTSDARELFSLFFEDMNPFINVLDEAIHNAASVMRRSPFLFTVVCAIASRAHERLRKVYTFAMHLAKAAAATAMLDGHKDVESVQAYLLLAAYPPPVCRQEDQRDNLYIGLARSIAHDIGLDVPVENQPGLSDSVDERQAREALNRVRTWVACWVMDGMQSFESNKPPQAREDEVAAEAATLLGTSRYQTDFDVGMPALVELLRVMRRFWDEMTVQPSAMQIQVDRAVLSRAYATAIYATSAHRLTTKAESDKATMPEVVRRTLLFWTSYSRLLVSWLPGSLNSPSSQSSEFTPIDEAANAAVSLLTSASEGGHPPVSFHRGAAFAGTFLLHLMHPRQAQGVSEARRMMVAMGMYAAARAFHGQDAELAAYFTGALKRLDEVWSITPHTTP